MSTMSESEREKLLVKIRALANMADPERGGTPQELETAARKMQELMDRYNISMLDVMNEKKNDPDFFISGQVSYRVGQLKAWHWSLARALDRILQTRHFSTGSYGTTSRGAKNAELRVMSFFGAKENVALACELYDKWAKRIDDMASRYTSDYLKELAKDPEIIERMKWQRVKQVRHLRNLGEQGPQAYRVSWLDGCVSGIHTTLYEQEQGREKQKVTIKRERGSVGGVAPSNLDEILDEVVGNSSPVEETVSASNAIQLYDANLTKAYKDFSQGFRTVRTNYSGNTNYGAYTAGQKVGRSINLTSKELKG